MDTKKVLIIKQENLENDLLVNSLKKGKDLEVVPVSSEKELDENPASTSVDLLVLESNVGEGSQVRYIQKIRSQELNVLTPVIAFSDSSETLQSALREAGVRQPFFVLKIDASMKEFQSVVADILGTKFPDEVSTQSTQRFKMDVEFLNSFIGNTIGAIGQMASTENVVVKSMSPLRAGEEIKVDLYASVEMKSDNFDGEMALGFSQRTLKSIYSKIMGKETAQDDASIPGAAGELVNVIYGGTKRDLNQKGFSLQKALPVFKDEPTRVIFDGKNPIIVLTMNCQSGEFYLFFKAHASH